MKKIIFFIIFFSNVLPAQTNAHFESSFVFSDFIFTDTLILGYNAFATDSLDPQLGEVVVPQVPTGQFGVRFQLPTDTSLYTLKDFRFGCGQPFYYEHLFDLSYIGGSTINIDWEWSFELLAIHIIDGLSGQHITTLEAYFDPSEYQIPPGMEKIILAIQYNGPLSWPEYEVTSPNGGEVIEGGQIFLISWWNNQLTIWMDIEFSSDSGETWEVIDDSISTLNTNYDWKAPIISSEDCLIRIGNYPCAYDISDSVFTITYPVAAEYENNLPIEFSLSQNYPNPFNPTTKIKYTIPAGTRDRVSVRLKVYDVLGNEIATLINEEKSAGEYEVEFSRNLINQVLPSGIYFYQMSLRPSTGSGQGFIETKKMILLR